MKQNLTYRILIFIVAVLIIHFHKVMLYRVLIQEKMQGQRVYITQ